MVLRHLAADKWTNESLLYKDLGDLIAFIDKRDDDKPIVILSMSRVVARLHARGKPNEQAKGSLRPLMEADSEFALAAMGCYCGSLDGHVEAQERFNAVKLAEFGHAIYCVDNDGSDVDFGSDSSRRRAERQAEILRHAS